MRIVVCGLVGQYAFGGVTWDYLQYVFGFRALGHDVWYLEDTGAWAYDPVAMQPSSSCEFNVKYLRRVMEDFDLGDRWIYRNAADGKYYGINDTDLAEGLISSCDVLVNVSGACWLRPPTAAVKKKLFLDGDPMFTQIGMATHDETARRILSHDVHFSFGLNIGQPGCRVPECGIRWRPTVQPIALEYWKLSGATNEGPGKNCWTTVMNWSSYKPKEFQGETYGQKDLEFLKFIDLPKMTGLPFALAMGQGVGQRRPTESLLAEGWEIFEPDEIIPDYLSYRNFLGRSRAEWSVAKNGYVKSWSGWFSCRSACYLALGKPVVVQDTGWKEHLPEGEGVLSFRDFIGATQAIREVEENYERHCQAARAYAEVYFDARKVCQSLLEV